MGVRVYEGSNTTIGGTTAAARNVISGNVGLGVGIGDGGPNITGNRVIGNYIGTDKTGTKDLGNSSDGLSIEDPSDVKPTPSSAARRPVSATSSPATMRAASPSSAGATRSRVTT